MKMAILMLAVVMGLGGASVDSPGLHYTDRLSPSYPQEIVAALRETVRREATCEIGPGRVVRYQPTMVDGARFDHVVYVDRYYHEPSRMTLEVLAEFAVDKAIDRGRTLARDNAQEIVTYGVAAVTAGTLFASLVGLVVRAIAMAFIRWLFRLRGD